jgi:anti-sigma B factor antagonist
MSTPESPATFSVRSEHRGDVVWLHAEGELDLASGPLLEQALGAAEALHPATIVLDFRDLTFIDSTGLHIIVRAHTRATENGRELTVVNTADPVRKVFEVSGVDRLLEAGK